MLFARRRSSVRWSVAGAFALLALACQSPTDSPVRSLAPHAPSFVVVPAQGTATSLDIANWNVEWFGDAANGPTNEPLQQSNVRDVIAGMDADIFALEEVVSASAWATLKSGLSGYTGILSNEAAVTGGSASYSASEQKVALLWKTSVASLTSAKIILTANDNDFAGRPPMEVKLHVTLGGSSEDLVIIVLHMKAFDDVASWTRRHNAAVALKSYLDATYPAQKVLVVGDWNDDVDTSITAGQASPYAAFVSDAARYTYPTRALSLAGVASTVSFPDFIDHQLLTNEMAADYIGGTAEAFRADTYVASYGTTTTDHFPVLSRFTLGTGGGGGGSANVIINEIMANEPGSNTAGEYVELVNVGTAAASIGGWTISDGSAVRHTFAAGTSLAAGQAIVVYGATSAIPVGLANAVGSSTGSLNLANAGDQVVLKNGSTVVNSFTYPSSLAGTDGVSMNRSPDASPTGAFVLHTAISSLTGSPGKRANGTAF